MLPIGVVIERLLARAVPRQHEAAPLLVPDHEGEHAAQPCHAIEAPFLVRVHDGLGVRAGGEYVPAPGQLTLELLEVVDLAVEDDHRVPILAVDGLIASRHVDDAEPPMAEPYSWSHVEAVGIGTTMTHDCGHPAEQLP